MRRLYLATTPQCLDELVEVEVSLGRAFLKGGQIGGILGQGLANSKVDHVRDRLIRGGRLHLEGAMDIGLEVDGSSSCVAHEGTMALQRLGVKSPNASVQRRGCSRCCETARCRLKILANEPGSSRVRCNALLDALGWEIAVADHVCEASSHEELPNNVDVARMVLGLVGEVLAEEGAIVGASL